MRSKQKYIVLCILAVCMYPLHTYAQRMQRNQLEIGVQGGLAYYVGDANPRLFSHVRESYGIEISYLYTPRWSFQLQGVGGRIAGMSPTAQGLPDKQGTLWNSQFINIDAQARFNFLPFGMATRYDPRVKQYTPYIFAGIGMTMLGGAERIAAYVPIGIGFRWICSEHVGMFVAWQHNICLSDGIEPHDEYNNIHGLNGSNILNCDLTSTLQFGIVFEFAREKKICKFCKER